VLAVGATSTAAAQVEFVMFDLTVEWQEDGPLETRRNTYRDFSGGTLSLSREVVKVRAATATVVGTVGEDVVDADSDSARFYQNRRRIFNLTLP
jgi:hypothetical protein